VTGAFMENSRNVFCVWAGSRTNRDITAVRDDFQ